MVVTDARVHELVRLTPSGALELLDKGRAGDAQSMADWSIYAVWRALRAAGAAPKAALHHTLLVAQGLDIQVAIKH